ncbi:MAG: DUF455 family protein [Sandaracinaceae bacterium]
MEPPDGTIERWAYELIMATTLEGKLRPVKPPSVFEGGAPARRIARPGRPPELSVEKRRVRSPGPEALKDPRRRAELLHTFFHHELQAAELACWGLLAFPEREPEMRRGLLRIALDEVRHAGMYAAHIEGLGFRIGAFPVRDWFWERVPSAESAESLLALLGVGLEGANLDHTTRFAERFRAAGDEEGARLQEIIGDEEIPHVRFAVRWLERWHGPLELDAWRALLPPPLTPLVLRGRPLDRDRRRRAGMPDAFVDALDAWEP